MGRRLIVDGNHLTGRCRATLQELSTSRGYQSGVILGFLRSLLWAETETGVEHGQVVVCWDNGRSEKRMTLYPGYKGNRDKITDDLTEAEIRFIQLELENYLRQLTALRTGLNHLGCKQVRVPKVEADDLLGILSTFYEEQGHEVVLYSGDHDIHQLVTEKVKVFDAKKGLLDVKAILNIWEVSSIKHIPYYKAIVGDKSDNITGIRGIGDVWAKRILACLDLSGSCPAWHLPIPEKCRKHVGMFSDNSEIVARNLKLMRIPRHWAESHYSNEQAVEALEQLLTSGQGKSDLNFVKFLNEWEINSMLENFKSF